MAYTLAIIPARYASTRFPGKPLADRTGQPLIQHVVEQVQQCRHIQQVIVATDDQRIFDAVRNFGGEAVMTRDDHPNGTCRLAEAVTHLAENQGLSPDLAVNVQGDEPEIDPAVVDQLVQAMLAQPDTPMGTVASPFAADEDPHNPNIVKVVLDQRGRALYFSRSLIPYHRDQSPDQARQSALLLKHLGLYAYRTDFLLHYVTLPATPLEEAEKLEQLRALEHGHAIAVITAETDHHGIDTPGQYDAFVRRYFRKRGVTADVQPYQI